MIAIIDYGAGNLFSVKNALDFLGLENKITNSAAAPSPPRQRHHQIAERRRQCKTQYRRGDQGETNHFSISKFMPKGYSSASFCSA